MKINKKLPQRQIPNKKEITANKAYTDMVYGYFAAYCEITKDKRKIIPKKKINYSEIARSLEISRQTVTKKIKGLEDLGLIQKLSNGDYEIITLPKDEAFLIALPTLRKLVSSVKERTIIVYVYLLNRFFANSQKPFDFSLNTIKINCGLSITTYSNNYIITDILTILQDI